MRKLLNTLFITSEDVYLALENENVVAFSGDERKGSYPLQMLENILSFSYKGASPALMGSCAERGINLAFLSPRGRFLARTIGEERGNVLVRKTQYRISDNEERSCLIARNMVFGKLYNSRWVIERTLRDHKLRVNCDLLTQSSQMISTLLPEVMAVEKLDSLRGLEGKGAVCYFKAFDHLILNQKDDFFFKERIRRPPMDRMNALLSFVYSILSNDCAAALEAVGLDAYVGFMHRDRPGRISLALDLMEELRPAVADRFCLTMVNTKEIVSTDFSPQETGAMLLSENGRKKVLKAWQERKKQEITHPYLKEKMPWGLVPYAQALLLTRTLRGDIDGYPPFLWK